MNMLALSNVFWLHATVVSDDRSYSAVLYLLSSYIIQNLMFMLIIRLFWETIISLI